MMGRISKPRSKFPYYKVHIFNNTKLVWIDARKEAFDTLQEAKLYITEKLSDQQTRILEVTERARRVYNEN